jgi:hypothetical protein
MAQTAVKSAYDAEIRRALNSLENLNKSPNKISMGRKIVDPH